MLMTELTTETRLTPEDVGESDTKESDTISSVHTVNPQHVAEPNGDRVCSALTRLDLGLNSPEAIGEAIAHVEELLTAQGIGPSPIRAVHLNGHKVFLSLLGNLNAASYKVHTAAGTVAGARRRSARRFVAVSTGNFARALIDIKWASGERLDIYVPQSTTPEKLKNLKAASAGFEHVTISVEGESFDDAVKAAKAAVLNDEHAAFLEPFNSPDAILGNSIIASRIAERIDEPLNLVSPIGGGGLSAGCCVGLACAGADFKITVVGAETSPAGVLSVISATDFSTRIDGSVLNDAVAVGSPGSKPLSVLRAANADARLVSDEEVIAAMKWLWSRQGMRVEPSAALPVAALMFDRVRVEPGRVPVLLLSGTNISDDQFRSILAGNVGTQSSVAGAMTLRDAVRQFNCGTTVTGGAS